MVTSRYAAESAVNKVLKQLDIRKTANDQHLQLAAV
jgi:hypothetical protein